VVATLIYAGRWKHRRMDMTELIGAFHHYANAPKNGRIFRYNIGFLTWDETSPIQSKNHRNASWMLVILASCSPSHVLSISRTANTLKILFSPLCVNMCLLCRTYPNVLIRAAIICSVYAFEALTVMNYFNNYFPLSDYVVTLRHTSNYVKV
jgi:hypothetical protein